MAFCYGGFAMKKDTIQYLIGLLNRAYQMDKKVNEFPVLPFYSTDSKYFVYVERRNEAINQAICVANRECGYQIQNVRIHQRNIDTAKTALLNVLKNFIHENAKHKVAV